MMDWLRVVAGGLFVLLVLSWYGLMLAILVGLCWLVWQWASTGHFPL